MTTLDRFIGRVEAAPNGCWNWQGRLNRKGYGEFDMLGASFMAHRASWILLVGDWPAGLVCDHLCRNPRCVNPTHLEPVTARENAYRGQTIAAANVAKTHCVHGHPLDGYNLVWADGGRRRRCRICINAAARRWLATESGKRSAARRRAEHLAKPALEVAS